MVHLEKDSKIKTKEFDFPGMDDDFGDSFGEEEEGFSEEGEEGSGSIDTLEDFAQHVLRKMLEEGIPPIPNNFQLYFDRLLDEQPADFKKQILQILDLEGGNDDEKRLSFEKQVRDSFLNTKQILQIVATSYKNLTLMNDIAAKRTKEIVSAQNPIALQNVITALQQDIDKLSKILNKQSGSLKELYTKNAAIMQEVDSETIYDSKFGVYNKRYLIQQVEKELKMIDQFGHKSTLVMAKLSDKLSKRIKSEKGLLLITRTISRLILKTSRRSDIIAHFGNGVFALLLKHSDLFSAKKASERLADLVSSTNFFYGDREVQLDISIGIAKVTSARNAQDTINCALGALDKADRVDNPFVLCEHDQDEDA